MPDVNWIETAADVEEAAALTAHLVSFNSAPGREGAAQQAIAAWCSDHGLQPEFQPVADGRPNVVVRIENGPGPTLLLNGHVDTVLPAKDWSSDPWQARREGDRLYGLGACDMKSGLAAAMLATRALSIHPEAWSGTLIFASVVDEEAYSIGAHALLASGITVDACVVTESAWEHPALGSVGKVLIRADVTGRTAHGSWPKTGINAATEAAKLIARLDQLPLGAHPRLEASQCVLSLHSGNDQYVVMVPERATFTLNRHTVPGESGESVIAEMQTLVGSLSSPATFEFAIDPPYYPPWEMSPEHLFVQQFATAYRSETGCAPSYGYTGFGDANLFAGSAGIPTIHFGPHGANFHQADEWADVPTIAAAVRVLLRLATAFLR